MSQLAKSIRILATVITCIVLAACNQTNKNTSSASSTFSGSLVSNPQQAKLLSARKRIAKKRKAEKEAFAKKRELRRAKRLSRLKGNRKGASLVSKPVVKQRKGSSSKRRKKRNGKVGQVMKVSLGAIKGTSYARVRGRSRGIHKTAPWRCVPKRLKIVLKQVSRKFGRVVINSTHRSHRHNRRVGGKRRSYHLRCQAVDFRVHGRNKGLTRWLANHPYVGGYNRYPSGYYHIDTGPKRTW